MSDAVPYGSRIEPGVSVKSNEPNVVPDGLAQLAAVQCSSDNIRPLRVAAKYQHLLRAASRTSRPISRIAVVEVGRQFVFADRDAVVVVAVDGIGGTPFVDADSGVFGCGKLLRRIVISIQVTELCPLNRTNAPTVQGTGNTVLERACLVGIEPRTRPPHKQHIRLRTTRIGMRYTWQPKDCCRKDDRAQSAKRPNTAPYSTSHSSSRPLMLILECSGSCHTFGASSVGVG